MFHSQRHRKHVIPDETEHPVSVCCCLISVGSQLLSSPCVPGLEAGVVLVHHNLTESGRSCLQSQQALERSKTRQRASAHLCGFLCEKPGLLHLFRGLLRPGCFVVLIRTGSGAEAPRGRRPDRRMKGHRWWLAPGGKGRVPAASSGLARFRPLPVSAHGGGLSCISPEITERAPDRPTWQVNSPCLVEPRGREAG